MKKIQLVRRYIFDRWYLPYLMLLIIYGFSIGYQATTYIRFNYDKGFDFYIFPKYIIIFLTPAFVIDAILKNNKYKKHRITKFNLFDKLKFVNSQLKKIYIHLIGYNPNDYKFIKDYVDNLKDYRISIYFNIILLDGLTYDEFKELNKILYYLEEEVIYYLEKPERLKNIDRIQKNVENLHNLICDFFILNEKFVNKEYGELQRKSMFRKIG